VAESTPPVAFPLSSPERVVEPVPPYATEREVEPVKALTPEPISTPVSVVAPVPPTETARVEVERSDVPSE
jgi:hypothetical protein